MKHLAAVGLVAMVLLAGSALPAGAQGGSHPVITPGNAAQVTRLGVMDCETGQTPISVAFSPDGSQVAYGCTDGPVHLWDLNFNIELATIPANHSRALAFSPDGSRLATGGHGGVIEVWNAATGERLHTLAGHTYEPIDLAFSPDGTLLLSGGGDGSVRLWHAGFGRELTVLHTSEEYTAYSVMFSPDGTLAAAVVGGRLRVWNVTTSALVNAYEPGLEAAAFMPDGTLIGSGLTIYQFSAGVEKQGPFLSGPTVNSVLFFRGDVFNPARSLIVGHSCDWRDCRVMLFDTATGQEIARLYAHTGGVNEFAFSPDGTRFASSSWDGTVWLWGVP